MIMETNKIYLGDCYELIKQISDKSVDCIYTDIPYLYDKGGCSGSEIALRMAKIHKGEIKDIVNGIDYAIFNEFVRVMKKVNCFIWCSKEQILPILNWWHENTNATYNILTWNKTNPSPMCNGNWLPDIEYCLYFNRQSKLNDGYEFKSKWFTSPANKTDKDLFNHPTIKPLELVKRHLQHTTQENDIVFDCFIGSGTTAVACKELNRQYIGMEISPKWHEIAVNRLKGETADGQLSFIIK